MPISEGYVEEFARSIVSGACRGDAYVKFPSWYDIFLVYRIFAPDVIDWTFRFLFPTQSFMRTSLVGIGRPPSETASPKKLLPGPQAFSLLSPPQQHKLE